MSDPKTDPSRLHLVVMAGGSGTRFWPKSTASKPKQFLSFGQGESLLVETLNRFSGWVPETQKWVVTTEKLAPPVSEQAPSVRVLAEPQGRNTAPCVYWAAREVAAINPDAVMLVMPSDHVIPRLQDFLRTVSAAVDRAAAHDELIALGVKPTRPETGYGYLELGGVVEGECRRVNRFVEKPNLERAREFFESGNYSWNGGMFIWRAAVILRAFDEFMPEMKKAYDSSKGDIKLAYPMMTATSIDYGIMERATHVTTFGIDCGWDDLGSWTSLETLGRAWGLERDGAVITAGEAASIESHGNIVDAPGSFVALLGVNDLIVARNGQAILVAHKDRAQDIRLVVEALKRQKPELL